MQFARQAIRFDRFALASLRDGGWLADCALLVAEVAEDEDIPPTDGFARLDERVYGDTRVAFLRT